ncbi:MAG: hypothetical protein Q9184_006252, partial [Pyrenodesmia sp. 2 TL-2023]
MEWLRTKTLSLCEREKRLDGSQRDPPVMAELVKMTNLSQVCFHRPGARTDSGYERTPKNWDEISTLVEDMNLTFSSETQLMQNPVTAMFMSNVLTMIEFSLKAKTMSMNDALCDCALEKTSLMDSNVTLYLSATTPQYAVAVKIMQQIENIVLFDEMSWYAIAH